MNEPLFALKRFKIEYSAVDTPSGIDEPFEAWIEKQLGAKYLRTGSGMKMQRKIRDIEFMRIF